MRGLFVTGTDTGVGKTVLSAALLAAMRAAGEPVRAYKPVLTGVDEPPVTGWPSDDELLGVAAGTSPGVVAPLRYGPAVSPHLAAELAGAPIELSALVAEARRLAAPEHGSEGREPILIVEGVGGLMVPLDGEQLVRDLARRIGLGLVVAARPGLGTINHTLMTLEAARTAGLTVLAVVLTPWPAQPDSIALSNRRTIEQLGRLEVHTLAEVARPDLDLLAQAAAGLPWRHWVGVQAP